MVRYKDWIDISEKAASVQRQTLKNLQKAWGTIDQDHLKNARKSGFLEAEYEDMRGHPRHLHSTGHRWEKKTQLGFFSL